MEGQLGALAPSLGPFDYIGWVLFASGTLIQIVADVQKYRFRGNPENRGMFCTVGLWSWSRHPNYYGEMLIWVGAFLCTVPVFASASLDGGAIAAGVSTILSPLFTIFVLTTVSGLPTCEGKYLSRYYKSGNGDAWEAYVRQTAPVILQPQPASALPLWMKRVFCCEFKSLAYKKELQLLTQRSASKRSLQSTVPVLKGQIIATIRVCSMEENCKKLFPCHQKSGSYSSRTA